MTFKIIDITNWQPIENLHLDSFYPEGSLSKHLLEHEGEYYLFKKTWTRSRPKERYSEEVKHQFWSEIIAAKIATDMGLSVPDTFVGINNHSKISFKVGVLNKWFLNKKDEFTKGSELLDRDIDDYSEQKHNLDSAVASTADIDDSLEYWMKLMLFDALIGNTDRHHENWGVINGRKLSPLYDNGISLGWRIDEDNFSADTIEEQMQRFKFKMKLSLTSQNKTVRGVIDYFLGTGKITKDDMADFIGRFNHKPLRQLKESLCTIEGIPEGYELTTTRFDFIIDFVCFRAKELKRMIEG